MTDWASETALRDNPFRVLLKRGEWVDDARDGRIVPYKIYHPADHDLERSPVIFWSHGFGGNRDGASFISRFLAGQGYTLVHMTHDGTDSSLWEGKPGHPWDVLRKAKVSRKTTVDRMLDIPFVIDQLSVWVNENPDVGEFMDLSRIGMSGHSFGSMTTQVMAGMMFPVEGGSDLSSLRDQRIVAGILYSPIPIAHLTKAAPAKIYNGIEIPLFHMTGTEDDSPIEGYDYKHRLTVRDHADHSEQYLQVLQDGDHMVYNGTRGKLANNDKREEHEREITHASFAFWQAYLYGCTDAKAWLQAHYL